nr:DUF6076 domain-containing protein [uncultured Tyzzerella sp.]
MLGKAYIKNNEIYVIFDNNNIGERTGMIYPLGYHTTHFTILNTDKLKQEYIKLIDYTLSLKDDNNTYLKNLSKIIDDFDLYSPYLHHYTQMLINIIVDEIQYFAKSNAHIKTYHLLNMSAYVYNNTSELRQGILNILDEMIEEIENIKNNLISEIQFLTKDFENLSPMEKLYLIDYDRKLVGKSPYYTEKYFTSNFEPSKIYIKKCKNKDELINQFNSKNVEIVEMFILNDSHDLIRFELIQMVKNNIKINKCKLCGNYFIPLGRTDTLYCDRIFTGGKSCKQLGARIKYKEKSKLNPIHIQYEKAYRRIYSKQRRKVITKEEFFIWSEKAKNLRDKCINNEISFDEFLIFLNSDKIKPID